MRLENKLKILRSLGFGDKCYVDSLNGNMYSLYSGFTHSNSHSSEPAIIYYFDEVRDRGFYYNNPLFEYLFNVCKLNKEVMTIFRQVKKYLHVPLKLTCINNLRCLFIADNFSEILYTNDCLSEMKKAIVLIDYFLQKLYKKYKKKKNIN